VVTLDPSPGDRVTAESVLTYALLKVPFVPVSDAQLPFVRILVPPGASKIRRVIFPLVDPATPLPPEVLVVTRINCLRQCLIGTGRPKLDDPYSVGFVINRASAYGDVWDGYILKIFPVLETIGEPSFVVISVFETLKLVGLDIYTIYYIL
jgi:hypothetical protein